MNICEPVSKDLYMREKLKEDLHRKFDFSVILQIQTASAGMK